MEVTKIYYAHYRYWEDTLERYYRSGKRRCYWTAEPMGGATECIAEISYGGNKYNLVARATCSKEDRFCYKTGKDLAKFRMDQILGYLKACEDHLLKEV